MEIILYILIGLVLIETGALIVIAIMYGRRKEKIDPLMVKCTICNGKGSIRDAVKKIADGTELHKIGIDDDGEVYRFLSCECCKGLGYSFTDKGAEILERLKKRGFLNE